MFIHALDRFIHQLEPHTGSSGTGTATAPMQTPAAVPAIVPATVPNSPQKEITLATPQIAPIPTPALTPVVVPASAGPQSAPHQNLLQKAGGLFKKIFGIAGPVVHDAIQVAVIAEPIVDIAFPGIAALYNSTVALVAHAEMMATAAGAQAGSGEQKLATVVSALTPIAVEYFKSQGIAADSAVITKWVNAVVASLNAIPAPNSVTVSIPALSPATAPVAVPMAAPAAPAAPAA